MGNTFTREEQNSSQNNEENEEKVSYEEFTCWKDKFQQDIESYKNLIIHETSIEYQDKLIEKDQIISDLTKELKALKKLVKKKKKKKRLLVQEESPESSCNISEEKLKEFVEELLKDENINIAYLPDWVERQLYLNFLTILMGFIQKTTKTSAINMLGHQINFKISPQND